MRRANMYLPCQHMQTQRCGDDDARAVTVKLIYYSLLYRYRCLLPCLGTLPTPAGSPPSGGNGGQFQTRCHYITASLYLVLDLMRDRRRNRVRGVFDLICMMPVGTRYCRLSRAGGQGAGGRGHGGMGAWGPRLGKVCCCCRIGQGVFDDIDYLS